MINEEKVKEMYQMALYDEYKKKDCEDTGKYYEKDYVGGQMIVSFFTGTIAYVCLFAIWSMANFEIVQAFMTKFNTANITFTFSTTSSGWFLCYWFVWKYLNPNFSTSFCVTCCCNTCCFYLVSSN